MLFHEKLLNEECLKIILEMILRVVICVHYITHKIDVPATIVLMLYIVCTAHTPCTPHVSDKIKTLLQLSRNSIYMQI